MRTNTIAELAGNMAKKSCHKSFKLGAVVHFGKRIISTGFNQIKSHPSLPQYPNFSRGLHAEMHATIGCKDISGSSLTVVRIRSNGEFGLAKPCSTCLTFLALRGVKTIYYSQNNSTELGKIKLRS